MTLPRTPTDPAERREAFCQEYVRNGGALFNAAVHAGYPRASAAVRANELRFFADWAAKKWPLRGSLQLAAGGL
jgi:hypothetical protein